jgi:hypothetical protein
MGSRPRIVCRIFLRGTADDKFRYIQTQRFWILPAVGETLLVRDINGIHTPAIVSSVAAQDGSGPQKYAVQAQQRLE